METSGIPRLNEIALAKDIPTLRELKPPGPFARNTVSKSEGSMFISRMIDHMAGANSTEWFLLESQDNSLIVTPFCDIAIAQKAVEVSIDNSNLDIQFRFFHIILCDDELMTLSNNLVWR